MLKNKNKLIYNSGVKLFGKYGVKKVSIDMIVKDAGVAKGTFYIYYKNKLELYEKIIDDILDCGKKYISNLHDNVPDLKERFLRHMIGVLGFFEKNLIIKNIVAGNKDYYIGKIDTNYLFSRHLEIMRILFGDEINDEELLKNISKIKGFFLEILNFKNHFLYKKDFEKFVLDFAAIITNGLFSDYGLLLKGRNYLELQKI